MKKQFFSIFIVLASYSLMAKDCSVENLSKRTYGLVGRTINKTSMNLQKLAAMACAQYTRSTENRSIFLHQIKVKSESSTKWTLLGICAQSIVEDLNDQTFFLEGGSKIEAKINFCDFMNNDFSKIFINIGNKASYIEFKKDLKVTQKTPRKYQTFFSISEVGVKSGTGYHLFDLALNLSGHTFVPFGNIRFTPFDRDIVLNSTKGLGQTIVSKSKDYAFDINFSHVSTLPHHVPRDFYLADTIFYSRKNQTNKNVYGCTILNKTGSGIPIDGFKIDSPYEAIKICKEVSNLIR